MAARKIAGTIRKATIDGIEYTPSADVNLTEMVSAYENSSVATAGVNMRKMVRRPQTREGLTLVTDADERIILEAVASSLDDVALHIENAAGDGYRATGWIEIENNETEENRTTVQLHPRDGWAVTIGES